MDENNNGSFFDKNTILAIGLSLLFFMGWQTYMQQKYPEAYKAKEEVALSNEESKGSEKAEQQNSDKKNSELDGMDVDKVSTPESFRSDVTFEESDENWSYQISSQAMGFRFIELAKYSDRDDKNIIFKDHQENIHSSNLFGTYFAGKPVYFNLEQKTKNHYVGTANTGGQKIIKEIILNPENYTISVSIKTLTGTHGAGDVLETRIANKVLKVESSMFTPAYEGTEFFSLNDGSEERERLDIESAYNEKLDKVALTSIGSQYFAVALNDSSTMIPKAELSFNPENQVAYASVFHPASGNGKNFDIKYTGFVGPKKYDVLKELEPNFVKMINYGVFGFLSKPMLRLLKWFYSIFQNWGLAIIFLTILIRTLLLPINLSSMKSMKKMQKIQPQLKAIKEKYKSDPTRMNQETMALMKKEGANPLGGCLPMLLQIPFFFALYSVLGQSVELYKSPFMFWIQDLSFKDPFFVLPIAVGVLYFIQMSITPQPTDPAQAKIMKFIPILFCFFMITVPSGLTLYFFVNTVFGIGQSFLIQREKRKATA